MLLHMINTEKIEVMKGENIFNSDIINIYVKIQIK